MHPGGHGRMAHDHNEDDGDPKTPGQERQPAREYGTLTVFFPVPHTVRCCEEGCRAAYAAAKWIARRKSLQRHLELDHGARIRRTINVCSICGETLGLRPASHACLAAANLAAPHVALPRQCGSCSMSFPTRRGLSNHEQWHRREAALAARRDLAAGAASGASEQDNDGTPPTEQDSIEGPAVDPPETPAVATEQAADQEPSPVAPRGTPAQSSDGEMAEAPSQRTPTQSGRTAAWATPSPTPSLLSNRGSPGAPASEAHEPAAMQELSPCRPESQDHDGSTHDFGTQEKHAGTTRPEGSAWGLEDETAELRALSRLPESAGEWARFENILDRAIAAATKHLRLPVRDSRQPRRNRRRAVRLITEGPSQLCPIDPHALQDHYSNLWSPTTVDTSILRSRLSATEDLGLCPFSPEEVAAKLRKCESTAPGEDCLTYHHWRQVDPEGRFLAAVYNVCLQYRRTPLSWKLTRTILIHKKGDREDPTNRRPIALGRTIAKLYAGCLTTRLQRWLGDHAVLSRCQKGFLPHNGVFEHNFVLQGRLDDAGTGGGELCVGFLDFANAFGSVAHQALVDAVRGAGVGEAFATIVEDLYRARPPASWQQLALRGQSPSEPVQGGDRQHNILAYADDLTLLAADPTTLQSRLDRVTALSALLGLRLNAAKCRSIHLSGCHPVGTRPTSFTVGGDPIPALGDFEGHKFLGCPVGFRVLPDETTVDEAIHLGGKLLSSMLGPWQRLDAIKTVLYPALNFAMWVGLASKGEWQRLDEELRPLIKKTPYVPARASNEYLYGSSQAGRAGIPLAAELSDICRVDGAFKLLTSTDVEVLERAAGDLEGVVLRRLRRPANTEDMEAYLSGETEGDFRQTSTQVQSVRTEARKASRRLSVAWEHGARINCGEASVSARNRHKLVKTIRALLSTERDRAPHDKPNQGKAMVCVAADPANSHFMRSGRYTRFSDWRFVHRAWLNLLPLNATRLWAPAADKRCRRCGYGEETLPHVLCHCMRQSRAMTERHNTIVARIKKAALGRFTVIAENQVVGTTSLKPDLVLARGEEALILDVCCLFENRLQTLQDAREAKEEKYAPAHGPLLHCLQDRPPCCHLAAPGQPTPALLPGPAAACTACCLSETPALLGLTTAWNPVLPACGVPVGPSLATGTVLGHNRLASALAIVHHGPGFLAATPGGPLASGPGLL
nr:uncharacterized protein LOC126519243 [Dermacentor andersoni]